MTIVNDEPTDAEIEGMARAHRRQGRGMNRAYYDAGVAAERARNIAALEKASNASLAQCVCEAARKSWDDFTSLTAGRAVRALLVDRVRGTK